MICQAFRRLIQLAGLAGADESNPITIGLCLALHLGVHPPVIVSDTQLSLTPCFATPASHARRLISCVLITISVLYRWVECEAHSSGTEGAKGSSRIGPGETPALAFLQCLLIGTSSTTAAMMDSDMQTRPLHTPVSRLRCAARQASDLPERSQGHLATPLLNQPNSITLRSVHESASLTEFAFY